MRCRFGPCVALLVVLSSLSCGNRDTPTVSIGEDDAGADSTSDAAVSGDASDASDAARASEGASDSAGADDTADSGDGGEGQDEEEASAGDGGPAAADASRDAAVDADTDASGPLFTGPCTPPNNIDQPAAKLSETGCMAASDPTKFASLVFPYEVNSPLWSDGADKTRGMVLPATAKIHVKNCAAEPGECPQGPADDGKWVFPVGTVMIKNFMFDGKVVETRLFVHHDEATWVGYSYAWDEAQTDATIVSKDGAEVMFNTGSRTVDWHYPRRLDCMTCHTQSGGSTLGPETAQMNRVVGGMNQIDALAAAGAFDRPVPKPYKPALVTPYAGQLGAPAPGATIEQRARSYLHANCAFCHRPDGDFYQIDLRYDVPFKDMNICNVVPYRGDVGVPTSNILTPGMPSQSVIWLRMKALPMGTDSNGRMPKLASYVVDQDGLTLIGDWIDSITACPM